MTKKINLLIVAFLLASMSSIAQQIQMPQASPSSKIIQNM
jgi:hypothetical protein